MEKEELLMEENSNSEKENLFVLQLLNPRAAKRGRDLDLFGPLRLCQRCGKKRRTFS